MQQRERKGKINKKERVNKRKKKIKNIWLPRQHQRNMRRSKLMSRRSNTRNYYKSTV